MITLMILEENSSALWHGFKGVFFVMTAEIDRIICQHKKLADAGHEVLHIFGTTIWLLNIKVMTGTCNYWNQRPS
jgi:hypothetical protein